MIDMTGKQKLTVGILAALACVVWLGIVFLASKWYGAWSRQPLGATLSYPTELQLPATWTAAPAGLLPTLTPASTLQPATQTPASPFAACNDLGTMTLLAIGTDVRPGEHRYGLSDVMRAVRVDFGLQRVTMLEFPRDLWVKIPGVESNQKLNTAYAHGGPDNGPGLLASTLDSNFGLKVDHYVVANMNVFAEVVDALGGLDVIIPTGGIDGRTSSDRSQRLVFTEGLQHLTGEQALTLARIRKGSVFARAEHQNMVMCALRKKIESPEVILRLPAIINSFLDNIQTDLTPEQISQLACLGTQIPRNNLLFASFPRELFEPTEAYDPVLKQDVFIWKTDFEVLRHYVAEFQTGTWPSALPLGTPDSGTDRCE